jgi:hypothetical protein
VASTPIPSSCGHPLPKGGGGRFVVGPLVDLAPPAGAVQRAGLDSGDQLPQRAMVAASMVSPVACSRRAPTPTRLEGPVFSEPSVLPIPVGLEDN